MDYSEYMWTFIGLQFIFQVILYARPAGLGQRAPAENYILSTINRQVSCGTVWNLLSFMWTDSHGSKVSIYDRVLTSSILSLPHWSLVNFLHFQRHTASFSTVSFNKTPTFINGWVLLKSIIAVVGEGRMSIIPSLYSSMILLAASLF